jgi:hypothetical protein
MEANSAAQFGGVGWIQRINIASTGVTLGTSTACTGSIENYGNGWYRASARITTGASPSGSPVQYLMALPSGLLTGEGMLTALPQFEVGSVPTSYIPTTTGSVTRDADVINKTSVSGLIGQTEGTIYAEIDISNIANAVSRSVIFLTDGTTSNLIRLQFQSVGGRHILVCSLVTGGVSIYEKVASIGTDVVNGILKIAFGYKSGNNEVYQNGVVLSGSVTGSGTFANLTNVNVISLGSNQVGAAFLNDRIRAAAVYKTRLPNYLLESATSQIQSYSALASSLSYTVV